MASVSGKFCPVCKHRNEPGATVCTTCGSPLESNQEEPSITLRVKPTEDETNTRPQMKTATFQKLLRPPKEGIAIYVKGDAIPIEIRKEKEFVLGRLLTGDFTEAFVDLKRHFAFENGVSRRHALIRRTECGYELLDLGSTNGTWLNNRPLVPQRPYPLGDGSQVQMGRLRIFVSYRVATEKP